MTAELLLQYAGSSTASNDCVALAASSPDQRPVYFDGFAEQPAQTAQALLCVARVARTRFYDLPGMIAARVSADPVVTAEADRLRFESFSGCCGVHARYDLLPDGLDVRECASGTTNVDFNPPMRDALARISGREPLRITVGSDSVEIQTLDTAVVEQRVPLPIRWVKGFGEVQVAMTDAKPLLTLDATQAQRFIRALPGGDMGNMTLWGEPGASNLRLTRQRSASAICVAAPSRLKVFEPLARFATSLTIYGDPDASWATATGWILDMPGSRLSLTMSPDLSRGFSGEGGLLLDLVSDAAAQDSRTLQEALPATGRFTIEDCVRTTELPVARARAALTWLGLHGHVGYDTVDGTFYWRRLPYPDRVLAADPPRLRDARALVQRDAVHLTTSDAARVTSDGREYRTSIRTNGFHCSCPWISKHGQSRGPCKHVLATAIYAYSNPRAPTAGSATSKRRSQRIV